MKKFGAFLFAASVVAAPMAAEAVAINSYGSFFARAVYSDNLDYVEDDNAGFGMGQSFSPYMNFAVSENLSATLLMQAYTLGAAYGSQAYGYLSDIATKGNSLYLTFAYLDYKTLEDKLALRIGVQTGVNTSYVYNAEQISVVPVAGITATYAVNENISVQGAWYRPEVTYSVAANSGLADTAIDFFDIHVPMSFSNINIIPSFTFVNIGGKVGEITHGTYYDAHVFPTIGNLIAGSPTTFPSAHNGAMGWWAGATAKYVVNDSLSVAGDFLYGSVDFKDSNTLDRAGFLAGLRANYVMDFGSINLLAWYGSGEDDKTSNGSESMPNMKTGTTFKPASIVGGPWAYDIHFDGDSAVSLPGNASGTPVGTMALAAGISNVTFIEKLNHSLWGMYVMGTNDTTPTVAASPAAHNYLTTKDALVQVGLTNWYNVNRNLVLRAEAVYALPMYDDARKLDENAMRVSSSIIYLF